MHERKEVRKFQTFNEFLVSSFVFLSQHLFFGTLFIFVRAFLRMRFYAFIFGMKREEREESARQNIE